MKRLAKNFIAILLSDVGRRCIGFAAVAYLTRTISVEDYGAMNVGLTLLSYGIMASGGGLSSFGTREAVRHDDPRLVNNILGTRLINSIAVYCIISLIAVCAIANHLTMSFTLIFCGSLIVNAFLLDWYFQGKEAMAVIGVSRLAGAAVYLGIILLMVRRPEHLLWIPVAAIVSDLVLTLVLILVYRRRNRGRVLKPDVRHWSEMMKQAFPIGAGSLLAHFSVNLPPLALGILLSNTEVGIYSAAVKLVFFLLILDRVMATLLFPASTRFFAQSPEQLTKELGSALHWIVVLALPVSVGGALLANRLLPFVFGPQYAAAAPTFRVLIWYFFFTLLHTIYSTALVVANREKLFGKLMLVSATMYVATVFAGAWLYGTIGAAAGMVISEALTVLLMRMKSSGFLPIRLPGRIAGVLLGVVVMGGFLLLFPSLQLFTAIAAGALLYGGVIAALRVVTPADLRELFQRV
jgi:O-antigen/teichoic acid export membrane protein